MTKNVGARSDHHDGRDRVTKNIGDVRARSEQGQNIVTVTKNIGDVGAGSEKSQSNVTVTKNVGASRSRVGVRSEQNMIHDSHSHHSCHFSITLCHLSIHCHTYRPSSLLTITLSLVLHSVLHPGSILPLLCSKLHSSVLWLDYHSLISLWLDN